MEGRGVAYPIGIEQLAEARELLKTAELEGASVGARGAFLSTFDFQAPDFYRRCGYEVYATHPDCPLGHVDYHLRKVF